MWSDYALVTLTVLSIAAALFCWYLYRDSSRREIATSELLCAVLLSPLLHAELRDVAYEKINLLLPPEEDHLSRLETQVLLMELIRDLGNVALSFAKAHGGGTTLRQILRSPELRRRYAKPSIVPES
jgi:hypothetical protein